MFGRETVLTDDECFWFGMAVVFFIGLLLWFAPTIEESWRQQRAREFITKVVGETQPAD